MRKKTKSDNDNSQFYESDWLELARQGFMQTGYEEVIKKQEELEKEIKKFHKAENIKAFNESCEKLEHLSLLTRFILGEYKKIFEQAISSSNLFQYHMTISDCFSVYCWISDNLVSFMLNNKDIKISHDVIVYVYNLERKKLDTAFEEFLKDFLAGKSENNVPISETIEYMIRKNKLLPNPDPISKKYTTSESTPEIIAWLKLKNLHEVFPPKLFSAMINTKCKPWIIKKYYRDI
jgi:hypothetical protein